MDKINVGFVGFGLIAGGIARSLKKGSSKYSITAYNRTIDVLNKAHTEGIVDTVCSEIDDTFMSCNIVFLCLPVELNNNMLEVIRMHVNPDCIISDVGSVKGSIHLKANDLKINNRFIGGHPMCGSEKTGYDNSSDHLLENAYFILTTCSATKKDKLDLYLSIVKDTKAIPLIMDYKEHDFDVAIISHLPHLIAANLVEMVKYSDNSSNTLKQIAAGGFKDITRIASSSATMWKDICKANSTNIVNILQRYIDMLTKTKLMIMADNDKYIYDLFQSSGEYRNSITDNNSGALQKNYVIYCDVADETGVIAKIATVLASNNISIKNIGIVHNRESEEGVLRIEFYDTNSKNDAYYVLKSNNYICA